MDEPLDRIWCVDCVMNPLPIRWRRPTYPGPRCYSHHQQRLRRERIAGRTV